MSQKTTKSSYLPQNRVSPAMKEQLETHADELGLTLPDAIRHALADYLHAQKFPYLPIAGVVMEDGTIRMYKGEELA